MTKETKSKKVKVFENRLLFEKSPYLLQHAANPVDWHPRGPEAFQKARKQSRPIFLSIGYSTCHWCHVMKRESFEDPEVARLMNDTFISIKVDREERPDIDSIYMMVSQMMTGRGGWPLTIIMTPDKKPFFAATYIPKETKFGRMGMLELIRHIGEFWTTRTEEIVDSANRTVAAVQRAAQHAPGSGLDEATLKLAYKELSGRFDNEYGGFSNAPKFPTPQNLLFLLRYWKRAGNERALEMVETTLQRMRGGGIYDHVGFGFHRYSTDSEWLVPHFEKMLHDQAMLTLAYLEAYQATGKRDYAQTTREILLYVLRDMAGPEGGFYSAEDAESEGEEGKFYLWTEEQIYELLEKKDANFAVKLFNIEKEGNFADEVSGRRSGTNILHLTKSGKKLSSELGISEQDLRNRIEVIRQNLFTSREERIHPHKDDKILTDWNGLMIAALAKATQVFGDARYTKAAKRAVHFILDNMRTSDGRLLHRYRDGQTALPAHLDDYAFLIWGLLELYEATFEVRYLQTALELNEHLSEHFWDDADGGYYFTADDSESLIVRQKDIYDGAVPSGNSVGMLNLLRLGRITADSHLEEKAAKIGIAFSGNVTSSPSAYTRLMIATDFGVGPSYEVVISGNSDAKDTEEMLQALQRQFIPNKVVILRPTEQESPGIDRLVRFTKNYPSIDGKATAYVCLDYSCELPTTDVGKMLQLLNVNPNR